MRAFVDNCEFKDQSYRGLKTENIINKFFEKRQKKGQGSVQISEFADLNLFIYIVIRDSKLLELRDKIEHTGPSS